MSTNIKPDDCVAYLLKFKPGTVLDLGAGKGTNVLFLAQNGFDVTAVDKSETAIREFLDSAKNLKLSVKGTVADIADFEFEQKYDFVISTHALQFLEKAKIDKLIQNIKLHTEINGINVLASLTEDNPAKTFPYLFKKGELKKIYADWNILVYEENTILDKQNTTELHSHAVAILIAKNSKPSSQSLP